MQKHITNSKLVYDGFVHSITFVKMGKIALHDTYTHIALLTERKGGNKLQ